MSVSLPHTPDFLRAKTAFLGLEWFVLSLSKVIPINVFLPLHWPLC